MLIHFRVIIPYLHQALLVDYPLVIPIGHQEMVQQKPQRNTEPLVNDLSILHWLIGRWLRTHLLISPLVYCSLVQ